jgi:hypothetical protein
MLCLDDAKLMRPQIKGRHIELVTPSHRESGVLLTEPLIITIRLSGLPGKTLLQLLDSGTNVPLLYDSGKDMAGGFSVSGLIRDYAPEGAERVFAVLPPQDMKIGTLTVHQVPFVTPAATEKDIPKIEVDGLLPTAIFRRVYISYADRFVVLEPW